MTIREALKKYSKLETELLLAHVLRRPKEFLFMHPEQKLTAGQAGCLAGLIRRRQRGEPVAYLLGYKDFCGLRFYVDKRVLVPRPETEWAVEKAAEKLKSLKAHNPQRQARVLDVGTGSGAIIVSLAKQLGSAGFKYLASDVSAAALQVARRNARTHKVKITFSRSNLLKAVRGPFDVLVANLPYGWKAWRNNTEADTAGLRFEPQKALFTGEQGLRDIRRLLEQLATRPYCPLWTYIEFDPRQKTGISGLIKKTLPQARLKFYRDLAKHWRYAEIKIG